MNNSITILGIVQFTLVVSMGVVIGMIASLIRATYRAIRAKAEASYPIAFGGIAIGLSIITCLLMPKVIRYATYTCWPLGWVVFWMVASAIMTVPIVILIAQDELESMSIHSGEAKGMTM